MNPYSTVNHRHMMDDKAGHIEMADAYLPQEEAHWLEVESRLHPPERWIQVGKATSVHTGAPVRSRQSKDEELVLGMYC